MQSRPPSLNTAAVTAAEAVVVASTVVVVLLRAPAAEVLATAAGDGEALCMLVVAGREQWARVGRGADSAEVEAGRQQADLAMRRRDGIRLAEQGAPASPMRTPQLPTGSGIRLEARAARWERD